MFVTTVSYPVVVDGEFMGVAAVNVPITELQQLAAHFKVSRNTLNLLMKSPIFSVWPTQLLVSA
jgi:hypothetical protein